MQCRVGGGGRRAERHATSGRRPGPAAATSPPPPRPARTCSRSAARWQASSESPLSMTVPDSPSTCASTPVASWMALMLRPPGPITWPTLSRGTESCGGRGGRQVAQGEAAAPDLCRPAPRSRAQGTAQHAGADLQEARRVGRQRAARRRGARRHLLQDVAAPRARRRQRRLHDLQRDAFHLDVHLFIY